MKIAGRPHKQILLVLNHSRMKTFANLASRYVLVFNVIWFQTVVQRPPSSGLSLLSLDGSSTMSTVHCAIDPKANLKKRVRLQCGSKRGQQRNGARAMKTGPAANAAHYGVVTFMTLRETQAGPLLRSLG